MHTILNETITSQHVFHDRDDKALVLYSYCFSIKLSVELDFESLTLLKIFDRWVFDLIEWKIRFFSDTVTASKHKEAYKNFENWFIFMCKGPIASLSVDILAVEIENSTSTQFG